MAKSSFKSTGCNQPFQALDASFCMTKLRENTWQEQGRDTQRKRGKDRIEQPPEWKGQSGAKWSEVEWRSREGLLLARGLCSFGFLPVASEKEKEMATASQYKYA